MRVYATVSPKNIFKVMHVYVYINANKGEKGKGAHAMLIKHRFQKLPFDWHVVSVPFM